MDSLPHEILNIILPHLTATDAVNFLSTSKCLYKQLGSLKIDVKNMRLAIEINTYCTLFNFNNVFLHIRKNNDYYNSVVNMIQYFFIRIGITLFTVEECWDNILYEKIFEYIDSKNINPGSILIINVNHINSRRNPFHYVVSSIHNKKYCPNIILRFYTYYEDIDYSAFDDRLKNYTFEFHCDVPPNIPWNLLGLKTNVSF
jgi:hypothetical protein